MGIRDTYAMRESAKYGIQTAEDREISLNRAARNERAEQEKQIAADYRAEVGIPEEEWKEWVEQTSRPYVPSAHVDRAGDEMGPWQENALRDLEGGL